MKVIADVQMKKMWLLQWRCQWWWGKLVASGGWAKRICWWLDMGRGWLGKREIKNETLLFTLSQVHYSFDYKKLREENNWIKKVQRFVLSMLSLRCLSGFKVKMSKRWLDTWIWSSVVRSQLEIGIHVLLVLNLW